MKKWISIVLTILGSFLGPFLGPFGSFAWANPVLNQKPLGEESDYSVATQLLEKKKWTEAAELLRALRSKDPKSVPILTSLSEALTHLGSREEALNVLKEGIQNEKGEKRQYLVTRINVLGRLFLTNKTFQTYQDGLNLLTGKKYRAAKEKFERSLGDEPDNIEILLRLGQSLVLENEPRVALPFFKLARRLNPFQPETSLWYGRTLFQISQNAEAIEELSAASKNLLGSEFAVIWLAEALSQGNQTNSAIRLLESDVKKWPLHVLVMVQLARLRVQMPHLDSSVLWAARKDLQLALSRLDEYATGVSGDPGDLGVDLSRPTSEIKSDIQKLFQQIENRLSQVSDQR